MNEILPENTNNFELTYVIPDELLSGFLQEGSDSLKSEADPHAILEMRISELWEKLEETNNNLNCCDSMLEAYCKTVTEKLKQKKCPNCLKTYSIEEAVNQDYSKVVTSVNWPPKTLIEEISSSLQKVENAINNGIDFYLVPALDGEVDAVSQQKVNGEGNYSVVNFCSVLQEVLSKMKTLETNLQGSSKTEFRPVSEEEVIHNKIEDGERGIITRQDCGTSEKHGSERASATFTMKDGPSSPATVSCIILSLAASALATEEKVNEKQQKRGIIGLGYGSGLGSYGYSGLGLGNAGLVYSGLGHSGLGVSSLGYSGLGLSGIGYGRSYGYAAAAPLAVAAAPLAVTGPLVAAAPVARTLVSTPLVSRLSIPVHAPVSTAAIATPIRAQVATPIAVATPITAHVSAAPVQAHIAAPITAHAPVAAFTTAHVATPVTTHPIAAPVHIASPITARIATPIAAPVTTLNLGFSGARLGHGRPLLH